MPPKEKRGRRNTISTTKGNYRNVSSVKGALARKGSRISAKRRKSIEEYIEYLQVELRLTDWFVVLHDDEPDDDGYASARIYTQRQRRVATVQLGNAFFDDEIIPDELRKQALIHELVHLHFEMAWHFSVDVFQAEMSYMGKEQAEKTLTSNLELGVDQLAYALTDLIPRPFKLDA